MDKYAGKRLDARYEVHELIGVGGMALVYRAYDVVESKNVAVKILKDEYFGNKEFMRRFKNESKAISSLSHPNIVKVLNVSFGTNFQYIVMEYISGITLKEYINKIKKIPHNDVLNIIKQILDALTHAHSKGIVHRDIKPQNIMISNDNSVKIMDFGIAHFFKNEAQTVTNQTIGSVHYISPEQARGLPSTSQSDIYSVGVILYEMLTNHLPFEADSAISIAIMHMQINPPPLREFDSSIPLALEEITLKAMQKDPKNRYLSSEDMLNDIRKFENDNSMSFGYDNCFVDDSPTRIVNKNDDESDDINEQSKKKKALYVVGGITATVVIFTLAFMFITMFTSFGPSRSIDVPNFVGMYISDIENNKKYKFHFQVEKVYDPSKPIGVVIDQSPLANSKKVKENSTILLKVNSSGILISVPKVSGLKEEEAKTKLSNSGFESETIMVDDPKVDAGIVVKSDPSENTKAPAKTSVKLFVSRGPDTSVKVPNIIGKSFNDAKRDLDSVGLKISSDIQYKSSSKPQDTVLLSSPLPGTSVNSGSSVQLVLSSGEKQEKNISIDVQLPEFPEDIHEVTLTVYVDGILDNSKTVTIDPLFKKSKAFSFKGSSGTKNVRIKINDQLYKVYEIDFDNLSYKAIS